jgi:hypothetical protein
MAEKKNNMGFIAASGVLWICFGIFGLINAPERELLTASQFVAGIIHLVYAFLLWRRSRAI